MKTAVKATLQVIGGAAVLFTTLTIGWGTGMAFFGTRLKKHYPIFATMIQNQIAKDALDAADDDCKYLELSFMETALR